MLGRWWTDYYIVPEVLVQHLPITRPITTSSSSSALSFRLSHRWQSHGVRPGEWTDHEEWINIRSPKAAILVRPTWAVASFCWKNRSPSPHFFILQETMPDFVQFALKNIKCPKEKGSDYSSLRAHHTPTVTYCNGTSYVSLGLSAD